MMERNATGGETLFNGLELPVTTVLFLALYNDSAKRHPCRRQNSFNFIRWTWSGMLKQNANVGLRVTQSDEKSSPQSLRLYSTLAQM
jgi:hypothetical protein